MGVVNVRQIYPLSAEEQPYLKADLEHHVGEGKAFNLGCCLFQEFCQKGYATDLMGPILYRLQRLPKFTGHYFVVGTGVHNIAVHKLMSKIDHIPLSDDTMSLPFFCSVKRKNYLIRPLEGA